MCIIMHSTTGSGVMRCSRFHACVVLSAAVQSADCFLVTGNYRLFPSSGYNGFTSTAAVTTKPVASAPQHESDTALRMGAGKKRRKAEKDALKDEGGPTKAVAREAQREADSLAQDLLEKCGGAKRDLGAIATDIENLRSRASALKPAQSFDLSQDWRLVFASDDDAICTVGTGLHKLPLTKMQDFFLTLTGGSTTNRRIKAIEVLRVLGPFPNLRNTLEGDCRSTGPAALSIRYTSMVDGTGKETGSSTTGEQDRLVEVAVTFAGREALVLETRAVKTMKTGHLIFAKEPDIDGELAKLRVSGDEASS